MVLNLNKVDVWGLFYFSEMFNEGTWVLYFVNRLNSMGESTLPWGTPVLNWRVVDV